MHGRRRGVWVVLAVLGCLTLSLAVAAKTIRVQATVETDPVPSKGDAADDMSIWIHPTDPAQSTVIGTDKQGGLVVYDLTGKRLQFLSGSKPNNVDLRYNFSLGGSSIALVGTGDRKGKQDTIDFYQVNPATRFLEPVAAREIAVGIKLYGFCMYHSPRSGKYYAFITSKSGEVQQWELFDNGSGKVDATKVRSFSIGSTAEGCVADDEYAVFYVAEEEVGIWKYGAEPGDGTDRTQVDTTRRGGRLKADVEGLTLYYASGGTGYLIASSQGASEFVVYKREGANDYVMTFQIAAGKEIDAVTKTDGIDVVNFPLGPAFPKGLFVAQDDRNAGNQNFKFVPWEAIAQAVTPPLIMDTTWDPRTIGVRRDESK